MSTHSIRKIRLSVYGGILLLFSLLIMGCKKSRIPDESITRFRFYLTAADSCFREYNFEQVKTYLDSASFRMEKVNDPYFLGYYYQLLGTYSTYKRNDSEAHANYYTAIDYYEKADEIDQLSPIYYNLAISYIEQADTGKLRQIVDKMQDISSKQKNEILRMDLYEIKAYYYSSLYEKRNQPENLLDSIILYEQKAISIFEDNPSIQSEKPNIAYNYAMLADTWVRKQVYNPDSVNYYLRKGEEYINPLDTALIINSLWVKGEIAYTENRYKEAENIFKQQINLMDQWSGKEIFQFM
jgi:tetratricopeptide (TPR) repeat protein